MDDLEAVKKRFREHNNPFSDCGIWGISGWAQIYFHDPAANVIDVHQVVDARTEDKAASTLPR